jgi:hypothetical protein
VVRVRARPVELERVALSRLQRPGVERPVVRRRGVWDLIVVDPRDGRTRRDGRVRRAEGEILDAYRRGFALRPGGGREEHQGHQRERGQPQYRLPHGVLLLSSVPFSRFARPRVTIHPKQMAAHHANRLFLGHAPNFVQRTAVESSQRASHQLSAFSFLFWPIADGSLRGGSTPMQSAVEGESWTFGCRILRRRPL